MNDPTIVDVAAVFQLATGERVRVALAERCSVSAPPDVPCWAPPGISARPAWDWL